MNLLMVRVLLVAVTFVPLPPAAPQGYVIGRHAISLSSALREPEHAATSQDLKHEFQLSALSLEIETLVDSQDSARCEPRLVWQTVPNCMISFTKVYPPCIECTIDKLSPAMLYYARVRSSNILGAGEWSMPSGPIRIGLPPDLSLMIS